MERKGSAFTNEFIRRVHEPLEGGSKESMLEENNRSWSLGPWMWPLTSFPMWDPMETQDISVLCLYFVRLCRVSVEPDDFWLENQQSQHEKRILCKSPCMTLPLTYSWKSRRRVLITFAQNFNKSFPITDRLTQIRTRLKLKGGARRRPSHHIPLTKNEQQKYTKEKEHLNWSENFN